MSPKDDLLFMEAMHFFDDEAFDFGGHPWFVRWRCLKMFQWEVGIKLFLRDAVKVKVKVGGYSLVSSAKGHSHDFTQLPPGHRTCSSISHLNSPGSTQPGCQFWRTELVEYTGLHYMSYQVPTYSWVERVHV